MAAFSADSGFKAQIISPDNAVRTQSLCDNLQDAKDWAENQSAEDDDTVQVLQLREANGGVSVSEIYEFLEGEWVKGISERFYIDTSTENVHQKWKCDVEQTESWVRIRSGMRIHEISIALIIARKEGHSGAGICKECAATLDILPI